MNNFLFVEENGEVLIEVVVGIIISESFDQHIILNFDHIKKVGRILLTSDFCLRK